MHHDESTISAFSQLIATPFDVVKVRLQAQLKPQGKFMITLLDLHNIHVHQPR